MSLILTLFQGQMHLYNAVYLLRTSRPKSISINIKLLCIKSYKFLCVWPWPWFRVRCIFVVLSCKWSKRTSNLTRSSFCLKYYELWNSLCLILTLTQGRDKDIFLLILLPLCNQSYMCCGLSVRTLFIFAWGIDIVGGRGYVSLLTFFLVSYV